MENEAEQRVLNGIADGLHSAMIHILRRVRDVDRLAGLSAPRLSLLSVLVYGGKRRMSELIQIEQISFAAMSKLVSGLEREGYLTRERDPKDERAFLIAASTKGKSVMNNAREKRVSALSGMLSGCGTEDLKILDKAAQILERLNRK